MSSRNSKQTSNPSLQTMRFEPLLASKSEIIDGAAPKLAIVLTTRVRLARNLAGHPFPGWAESDQRQAVLEEILPRLSEIPILKRGIVSPLDRLTDLEKQILFERHLISRDLMQVKQGAGVAVSRDQIVSIMVNEEDHLRLQVLRSGFCLRKVWNLINSIDQQLEEHLDFAFRPNLGYLTACPSNVGTGMRASVMMHLPGLVMSGQMDKVVQALNQLGIVVRGLFGEGSDASGSIYQISNQMTLGESEEEIIKRLHDTFARVIEQEQNARERQLDSDGPKLLDRIGRAYGVLQNSHMISSAEAINQLALLRLGIDLGLLPEENRAVVDRLLIECQPGHVQFQFKGGNDASLRDVLRARLMRSALEPFPRLEYKHLNLT